jgi:hypothetical protein
MIKDSSADQILKRKTNSTSPRLLPISFHRSPESDIAVNWTFISACCIDDAVLVKVTCITTKPGCAISVLAGDKFYFHPRMELSE